MSASCLAQFGLAAQPFGLVTCVTIDALTSEGYGVVGIASDWKAAEDLCEAD